MKLYFTGAGALMDGITFLAPDLGFEVAEDAAYRVAVKETEENALTLTIQGEEISITYDCRTLNSPDRNERNKIKILLRLVGIYVIISISRSYSA